MKVFGRSAHLTYCTNVHPGETWAEVRANLERYVVGVKSRVSPRAPFGIGLRLSAAAACSLAEPACFEAFREFLAAHDLYVFTMNGFPYGVFHGTPVKAAVYQPDWRDTRRLEYSNQLAELLAALLPADPEVEGSVSTVPGAFKPAIRSASDVEPMAAQMLRHVAKLVELRESTGRTISLALEPEPCCYLETIDETVTFFKDHLISSAALRKLEKCTGLSRSASEETIRRHLGICFDTCHAAVEYEQPVEAFGKLKDAGIDVKKLQLSAGLRIPAVDRGALAALEPYIDEVYLHQVVERRSSQLRRYLDLPEAIRARGSDDLSDPPEWRVHFHVPIFLERLGAFESTQAFLAEALALQASGALSQHLEVETYTWEVLPRAQRAQEITAAVARELSWVLEELRPSISV